MSTPNKKEEKKDGSTSNPKASLYNVEKDAESLASETRQKITETAKALGRSERDFLPYFFRALTEKLGYGCGIDDLAERSIVIYERLDFLKSFGPIAEDAVLKIHDNLRELFARSLGFLIDAGESFPNKPILPKYSYNGQNALPLTPFYIRIRKTNLATYHAEISFTEEIKSYANANPLSEIGRLVKSKS